MKKEYDFSHAKRGAVVPVPPGKTRITIRLDIDLLAYLESPAALEVFRKYGFLIAGSP